MSIGWSIAIAVEAAKGRVPVIAGCGTYSTRRHRSSGRAAAADVGADAALVVVPYYNKPSQAGLAAHFTAIAERRRCRSSSTMSRHGRSPTFRSRRWPRLRSIPGSSRSRMRPETSRACRAQRLACGEDFVQLSGNDDMALGFNAMGGVGCISVTANVAPKLCSDFQKAMREGRWDDALKLQDRLYPLHAALFTDASPAPTKYALSRLRNDFPAELRLPLVEASDASKRAVDAALEHAGLI